MSLVDTGMSILDVECGLGEDDLLPTLIQEVWFLGILNVLSPVRSLTTTRNIFNPQGIIGQEVISASWRT
ncbi:hypothetical protein H2248_002621 [Termitomyces sp. 'cryptogamus']|nr:hypothetical protein H2248_002621 [Termitomyces sp. 'cryptogamus']